MSNGALWATSTQPRANSRKAGSAASMPGASATIESVMPVRTAMKAGMSVSGLTSVWNSPSTSPPRTLTAPISVISAVGRRAAGRLEVDDAEGDVAQRAAELVEGALGLPARRRRRRAAPVARCGPPCDADSRHHVTYCTAGTAHGLDRRARHRQPRVDARHRLVTMDDVVSTTAEPGLDALPPAARSRVVARAGRGAARGPAAAAQPAPGRRRSPRPAAPSSVRGRSAPRSPTTTCASGSRCS